MKTQSKAGSDLDGNPIQRRVVTFGDFWKWYKAELREKERTNRMRFCRNPGDHPALQ